MSLILAELNAPLQGLVVALVAFFTGSGGYWAYLRTRREAADKANDAHTKLLMGLAQDKIIFLGMKYIERGWVTEAEYNDLKVYLYDGYAELGGNGSAERIMKAVERLPFRPSNPVFTMDIRETDSHPDPEVTDARVSDN